MTKLGAGGVGVSNKSVIPFHFKELTVRISMTAEKLKNGIVRMAAEGVPLSLFMGEGFSSINGEMAKKLGVSLQNDAVRSYVISTARAVEGQLVKDLAGKLVYVKTDSATRRSRCFLGVNVQYFDETIGKSQVRTLALLDTERQHASREICKMLESTLHRFSIPKENVLCVVVDNASNMSKTVQRLNEDESSSGADEQEDICDDDGGQMSGDGADDQFIPEVDIHHMRCSAHTLQLAIRDGLRKSYCDKLLTKVRAIANKLRAPNLLTVLEKRKKKRPILDTPTRWGSTFMMIQRFLELKDAIQDLGAASPDLHLSETQWEDISRLREILDRPYLATVRLQKESLTPGEMMKELAALKSTLSRTGGQLADDIRKGMLEREKLLFDNDIFVAAVFVDPRYRVLLTPEQCSKAKQALKEVAMKATYNASLSTGVASSDSSGSAQSSGSSGDEFEKELDELEMRHSPVRDQSAGAHRLASDLNESIDKMISGGRLKGSSVWPLLDTYDDPLKKSARIVSSLPVTQVSVERLFSSMRFILSDLRQSMKQDLLEALLLLRANRNCL